MIRPWCVYRLYDAEGALLYVGSTSNLPSRLGDHRRKQPWGRLIASWTEDSPHTRPVALRIESVAFDTEKPLYGKRTPRKTADFDPTVFAEAIKTLTMPTIESIEAAERLAAPTDRLSRTGTEREAV